MTKSKSQNIQKAVFYLATMGVFTLVIYMILHAGTDLEAGRNITQAVSEKGEWSEFIQGLLHNFKHPLAILLAQIATIIIVARSFGWIFKKIGQPTVIGEIIAGIALGPSLLGSYFPEFSAMLFPVDSLGNLQFLSQIGLILFMFVIGMELDLKVLKNQAHDAVVISHASIVIPFALGVGLAYFIYQTFAPSNVEFSSFALFMGIAMSITAFPVLARIVQERGIHKTRLGTIVITCAAADDITAWCILAVVIAIVKAGTFVSSLYVMALAVGYVFLMIKVVKPFLKRIGDLHTSQENLSKPIVAIFFLTLILSAYATEAIGIHALFGAFMTGAIFPDNIKFRNIFIEKVEDVAVVFLLPLFFVFTGLRTQIGLLDDPSLWGVTGAIILVAVVGKFFGSAISAKFVGQSWKDSLTIGALMNTRGLMELVVLNIGFDLGVLTPEIFAMMVIMALVTTMMTGPALDVINFVYKPDKQLIPPDILNATRYKILISFGNPQTGRSLVRLANFLTNRLNGNAALTAMHLSPTNELHSYNIEKYENESFQPVLQEAKVINQKITTLFKASNDIESDISETANKGEFDLLLIGIGQSIFQGSLLGKIFGFTTGLINPERLLNKVTGREKLFDDSPFDERTKLILAKTDIPVGVFIDNKFHQPDRIFIPISDRSDSMLIEFVQRFIHHFQSQVIIQDLKEILNTDLSFKERIRIIEQTAPNHIAIVRGAIVTKDFIQNQDIMIVSLVTWKHLVNSKSEWLKFLPSTLIVSQRS